MSPNLGISVVLPVMNQADHIDALIREYIHVLQGFESTYELILVVNGSRDNTLEKCQALAREFPEIRVEQSAPGWGAAVRTGLSKVRGKTVCYTNSARTPPERLRKFMVYGVRNPDVVVKANRRRQRSSFFRRLGSLLYNIQGRMLFDLPMWDLNGTPKIFPSEFLPDLSLEQNDDLIDLEFNYKCKQKNLDMIEVPVLTVPRSGGVSTTNIFSAVKLYLGAFNYWRHERNKAKTNSVVKTK